MKVGICIPTFNRDKVLVATIKYACNQTRPADEILVVDQTPVHEPEVQTALDTFVAEGKIRYFRLGKPSLPAARNVALRETCCDYLIYIDDDVVLSDDFVERYEDVCRASEVMAVAGGVDQARGWPTRNAPPSWPRALDYRFFHIGGTERVQGVATFLGANHCVNVAFVRRLGGYDERFKGVALREETDLALRIFKGGGRIDFEPTVRLLHLAAPAGGCRKVSSFDISAGRSAMFFAIKHWRMLSLQAPVELWFSLRLSVFNKFNARNPLVAVACLCKYLVCLVEVPITLLTRPSSDGFRSAEHEQSTN